MQTKLTLRLDERLIRRAKTYARKSGKSVSQIVGEYFLLLVGKELESKESLPPTVRALKGAMKGPDVDRDTYRRHLEEKYL